MDEEPPRQTPKVGAPTETSPWALAGLGMQFFVALIAFVYAGNWADKRFGTAPVFLLLGVFLGGGGTFFLSYRRLIAPKTSAPRSEPTDRESPR